MTDTQSIDTSPAMLDRLMQPQSIAVIGASADSGKRGYQILQALERGGYRHRVYPVNPKGGTILGYEVVRSVEELPRGIDLAVIARPAADVADIIVRCTQIWWDCVRFRRPARSASSPKAATCCCRCWATTRKITVQVSTLT